MIFGALGLIVLFAAYVVGVVVINRTARPEAIESGPTLAAAQSPAGPTLSILTWNIGYGGMGAESDFIMDMGVQKRPLDATLVDKNAAGVTAALGKIAGDIVLAQEAARPSWNTYRRDVIGQVAEGLPDHALVYRADIDTVGVPAPLSVSIGSAILSRTPGEVEWRGLPLEPTFEYGAFRKLYRMHILRFDDAAGHAWTVVNIHLSAFDTPEAQVREEQLRSVLAFAEAEHAAGRRVAVGGDWNLRLTETEFPHSTDAKYLFWVRDLPEDVTPDGWTWAVDAKTPTVRTAHQPYRDGENYRLIVDGFLLSPNVELLEVEGLDLGFQFSDHNPVRVSVRARPAEEVR